MINNDFFGAFKGTVCVGMVGIVRIAATRGRH